MSKYERIEWTNIWIEERGKLDKKRILLVGDSITQASVNHVKQYVGDDVRVDALTTSRGIDEDDFRTELLYMLGMGEYDLIHFNNGLHSLPLLIEQYEASYEAIICEIAKRCPKTRLVLGLSTPLVQKENAGVLNEKNDIVLERNRAVLRIAEKYGLVVNDNYSAVVGNAEIRSPLDMYHFTDEGYRLIAARIGEIVKQQLY